MLSFKIIQFLGYSLEDLKNNNKGKNETALDVQTRLMEIMQRSGKKHHTNYLFTWTKDESKRGVILITIR